MREIYPESPVAESERVFFVIHNITSALSKENLASLGGAKDYLHSELDSFDRPGWNSHFERLLGIHDHADSLTDLQRADELSFNLESALERNTRGKILDYQNKVSDLISSGVVDQWVADFFLNHCFSTGFCYSPIKEGIEPIYAKIVDHSPYENESKKSLGNAFRFRFSQWWADRKFDARCEMNLIRKKDNGQVLYFGHKYYFPQYQPSYRIYLNAFSTEAKRELSQRLHDELLKTESKIIHFKVSIGKRRDGIVLYIPPDETSLDDATLMLDSLLDKEGISELLADSSIPTGVELFKGISLAVEPPLSDFSDFFDARDYPMSDKRVSYNFLMAFIYLMSQALASSDQNKKFLSTGEYFHQLLLLSQINPETMMPFKLRESEDKDLEEWEKLIDGQVPSGFKATKEQFES